MKFHKEISNVLQGSQFNKNKTTLLIIVSIVVYLILSTSLIYQYTQIKDTVEVCVTKGNVWKNQMLVYNEQTGQGNIQPYKMTKYEYNKYALNNTQSSVIKNKIVLWDQRNLIIGKYSGYTKADREYLMYTQIMKEYTRNDRLILYTNPGKNIVELDINNSNLGTFKKMLQVGDKINIGCTYDSTYTMNLSNQVSTRQQSKDVDTVVVTDLFVGVTIADILNSSGESLLDYYNYLNNLTTAQRLQIEATDEYQKKTKVQNLLLALTPQEEKEYRDYASRTGIKFNISIPPAN